MLEMLRDRDMAKNETLITGILPKRPMLHGIASLFDFHGTLDRDLIERIRAKYRDPAPIPSTEDAIRATWQSVGDSMRWAIGEYDKTLRDNETVSDEQSSDTKRCTGPRKSRPMAALRSVDADETRVRYALRSADANLRRALERYNMILGKPDTK